MVVNLMTKAEIKAKIFKHYISLRKLNDYGVTAYVDTDIDYESDRIWSIVMCLDEIESIKIKIAYRNKKSIMTDYDWDFIMPYDDGGNVDDTESYLCGDMFDIDNGIDFILKEYERIEEQYFNRSYEYYVA